LHERAWLSGFGWSMVGAGGQLLERSIIDRVCGTLERLAFEGRPVLVPPISQDFVARRTIATEGEAIDTIALCPPLNVAELAQLSEFRAREAHRLAGDIAMSRERFVAIQAKRLEARTGIDMPRARKTVERQCSGVLLPSVELPFDDEELEGKTVADVLADPSRFEGETLADPVEGVEYGRCKARVMRRADGSVWINSFAHGRTTYELKLDFVAVKAAVEKASTDDAVETFIRLVLNSDLREHEIERLKEVTVERSGVGRRALAASLKSAQQQHKESQAQADLARRAAERSDQRPQLNAPANDAEWLPQMSAINHVLSASRAAEPPTRDFEGFLNQCRSSRSPGLHSLTSLGANAIETEQDRIPAPDQLQLVRLDEVEASELIERNIEYTDQRGTVVHLHPAFVKHYFKRRDDLALRVYILLCICRLFWRTDKFCLGAA
jgi:hypothetical protein